MKKLIVLTIYLIHFPVAAIAASIGHDIGGVSFDFESPAPGFNEACSDQSIKLYVSKSTDAQFVLVTCYANMEEWSKGQGTILHKIEVAKVYENKQFNTQQFGKEKLKMYEDLRKYNSYVLKNSGKLTDFQIMAIDSIKNSSDIPIDIEIKNNLMKEFESSDSYVIVGNSNKVVINNEVKLSHSLICFINIKGKILTLKSANTVQGDESLINQLNIFKSWIRVLQAKNK